MSLLSGTTKHDMERAQEELGASYDWEDKLQQELEQTRQQLQELQAEKQALEE